MSLMTAVPESCPDAQGAPRTGHSVCMWSELAIFGAGVVVLIAVAFACTGATSLFARHLWVDEMLTHALVSDPDVGRAIQVLRAGVDTHPPALYAILRAGTLGGLYANEVTLRLWALVFVLTAILGLYVSLRESFDPVASAAGCLAVLCHPLVLAHAVEARFYGAWLAAAVWYAYALRRSARPGAGSKWMLGVVAILLCTIHYFGIITWFLITVSDVMLRRSSGAGRFRGLAPALLGPVALAACLPLLSQQRAGYTMPTWVPPPTLQGAKDFVVGLLLPVHLPVVLLLAWLAATTRRDPDEAPVDNQSPSVSGAVRAHLPLVSLALLPLILVAFSYAVQPVLVDRYGLPAAAALAPVVAFIAARAGRGRALTLCGVLVVFVGWHLTVQAANQRERDQGIDAHCRLIAAQPNDVPVVFENPHELFAVHRYAAKDTAERCFYLDFEIGDAPAPELPVVARDLVRSYVRFHPEMRLMPWREVRTLPRFFLVTATLRDPARSLEDSYVGFAARHVGGHLYEMVARTD